ncbi:MAG: hypothetical protein RSB82_04420 [Victivallaceae bacterium]
MIYADGAASGNNSSIGEVTESVERSRSFKNERIILIGVIITVLGLILTGVVFTLTGYFFQPFYLLIVAIGIIGVIMGIAVVIHVNSRTKQLSKSGEAPEESFRDSLTGLANILTPTFAQMSAW